MRGSLFISATLFGLAYSSSSMSETPISAPAETSFFKLQTIEAVNIKTIWQVMPEASDLTNGSAILRYWLFRTGYQNAYQDEDVPVAVFLVGKNNIKSKPFGFQVTAQRKAYPYRVRTGSPEGYHTDALFTVLFTESECEICEEGRILIYEKDGAFILETDNINLNEN